MSFRRLLALSAVAATLVMGNVFSTLADDVQPQAGSPLPYKIVSEQDPEIQALWGNYNDGYINKDDPIRAISIAHFKDAKDRDVTVSQIYSNAACGIDNCPTIIAIDKEIIADTTACAAQDNHLLVPSKTAVFLCDDAIPLETAADKAAAAAAAAKK